jgi:hypothetical protein
MSVAQVFHKNAENQEPGKSDAWSATEEQHYTMLLIESSEYQEGEAAFSRGLTVRDNPYPFFSSEYWRWQEGVLGNSRPRDWQEESVFHQQDTCYDDETCFNNQPFAPSLSSIAPPLPR